MAKFTMNEKIDTTDDFLKSLDGNDFFEVKKEKVKDSNVKETKQDDLTKEGKESLSMINESTDAQPELMGTEYPEEYVKIVNRIKVQYDMLPHLNYDNIYQEISALTVKSNPTPTLEVLNDELHRVQAAKDRLSDILIDVIKCYNFKKRAVDILKDSWGKFTSEKNTEGRKGDATFRLSHFLTDFSQTESLSKACDHVLKNLDSLQDNLSRRITIWQLLLKLREGRMALPDHNFDKEIGESKMDELFGKKEEDSDEESGPKLRQF